MITFIMVCDWDTLCLVPWAWSRYNTSCSLQRTEMTTFKRQDYTRKKSVTLQRKAGFSWEHTAKKSRRPSHRTHDDPHFWCALSVCVHARIYCLDGWRESSSFAPGTLNWRRFLFFFGISCKQWISEVGQKAFKLYRKKLLNCHILWFKGNLCLASFRFTLGWRVTTFELFYIDQTHLRTWRATHKRVHVLKHNANSEQEEWNVGTGRPLIKLLAGSSLWLFSLLFADLKESDRVDVEKVSFKHNCSLFDGRVSGRLWERMDLVRGGGVEARR